jgi:hypothetical protein
MKPGDIVIFESASDEQVNWGSNKDPRKELEIGHEYEIQNVEVHSWHTKVWVYHKGVKGPFNSVHFEKIKRTKE